MSSSSIDHPVDALTPMEKNSIYFSRVVDLAVVEGLLTPDPDSEIGHFAFSRHYEAGKALDRRLQQALQEYRAERPEEVRARKAQRDLDFLGVVDTYDKESVTEKILDLIRIGASYAVWPTGTSFVLTYPWDPDGTGHPVKFRDDLSDFMKRRVRAILKKAGKLRNPGLFGTFGES